ncbi:MAG TPA: FKBP-type peptidyl-prolyl cis-trans isomerase [Gemmataceae bacterium]|nr:FKBP-type peptidyl-prolyl cis-trans isomerase [Gemmataceae bacterium]
MTKMASGGLIGLALLLLPGCGAGGGNGTITPDDVSKTFGSGDPKITTLPSGLMYQDVKEGTGAEAETGKSIHVHYTGYFVDGAKFDSSLKRGTPFQVRLGAGQVIRGWELGIVGMKEGGKRKLLIPSALGYGPRGSGASIPPNTNLVFDIELLKVE